MITEKDLRATEMIVSDLLQYAISLGGSVEGFEAFLNSDDE